MSAFQIKELIKKKIVSVTGKVGDDELIFTDENGVSYRFFHERDCCESVTINDIVGDLNDLCDVILLAFVSTNSERETEECLDIDSFTWTFYNFTTIKGHVTIKWLGISNGYYSESVAFEVIEKE